MRDCNRCGTPFDQMGKPVKYCGDECRSAERRERQRGYWRDYARRNKDRNSEYIKEWRSRNVEYRRMYAISRYGISIEEYQQLLEAQGNACAICKCPEPRGRKEWHIDHDHSCCPGQKACGKCVRGILCWMCNQGLGMFGDDATRIEKAIAYLEGK